MPELRSRAARKTWWVFLLILVADTVLVSLNIARSARNDADVTHTLQVRYELNQLDASLADTETRARGYVIAGTAAFLDQYQAALPRSAQVITNLEYLTSDSPAQQKRLQELAPLIERRLSLLADLVAARQQPDRNPVREVALVSDGKRNMDQIHRVTADMQAEEERLYEVRRGVARSTLITSIISAVVGGALTVGMLVLTTSLIRREREVRRRGEASLRQSEERFRLIAESLPQFVWVADPNGHYEYCNRRWLDYAGLVAQHSLGYAWSGPLYADDREHFTKLWNHALTTGEAFEAEARFQRPGGESRWFLVRVMPLRDSAGRLERWLGTATDIDDQKRANEALEARVRERTAELHQVITNLYSEASERERTTEKLHLTTAELTRSNKELEQFAYLASHDLQEPLRKIQSFGDRLKAKLGEQVAEAGREYIERIQSSAARMRRLIDDLLAYARVTTRPQPFADVDLNLIAEEVLSDLEDAIQRTSATVDVGPLPTIRADALQMRQMLQNLLTNSLKFHKPDQSPAITVRAVTLGQMPNDSPSAPPRMAVRIDFTDNGIGFENTYRDRIFDVFQRLHGRNDYEGTGIGLAVVRKIAERHGGSVIAHGIPGAGATFSVILPMNDSEVRKSDSPSTAAAAILR
jgi:PAS domain S-box-containing protein